MKKIAILCYTLLALLLLLSCLSENAQAQSTERETGFVVTAEGDTLYGSLKLLGKRRRSLAVRFRQNRADAFAAYTPEDLKVYVLEDGTRYESRQITQSRGANLRFLQLHVEGVATLYSMREANGEELFYLDMQDGELVPLRKKSAAGVLSSLFSACSSLDALSDRQKRKQYRFTVRQMMDNVITYNECVRPDRESIAYQSFEKLTIRPGVRLGVNMMSLSLHSGRDFSTEPGFLIGAFFNIGPKGRNSPFSIQPEVLLQRKRASSRIDCRVAPTCVDGIDITLTSLQVPLLLKLRFPVSKALDVSAVAGPGAGLVLADQSKSFRINQFEQRHGDYAYADWSFGLTLGVGIQYRQRYSLEVRLTEGIGVRGGLGVKGDPDEESKERLLQFTIGLMR